MNTPNDSTPNTVTARLVAEHERMEMLPKHFGRYFMVAENMIYDFARLLVPDYRGAYWEFYETSNGGFYMAPQINPSRVYVDGNDFDGQMSADAIGLTVCLFTYSHGSFRHADDPKDTFARHYHLLRDFSYFHTECPLISAAID